MKTTRLRSIRRPGDLLQDEVQAFAIGLKAIISTNIFAEERKSVVSYHSVMLP
jgi:hypothetical protein